MSLFVGIDGGGTRTVAVLTDAAGQVLAEAEGPSGRVNILEPAAGAQVLAELTRTVLHAGGAAGQATSLCCGLSGAGRPAARTPLELALRGHNVAHNVLVVPDAQA